MRLQDARRTLVAELGLEPSPALRRLERAVLEQDPELGIPDALPPPPRPRAPCRARSKAPVGARRCRSARADCRSGRAAADGRREVEPVRSVRPVIHSRPSIPAPTASWPSSPLGTRPPAFQSGPGQRGRSAPMSRRCRASTRRPTVKTFATGALPIDLAAGAGALWVLQGEKSGARRASYDTVSTPAAVARIDPLSGTRRGISPLPVPATATLRVPLGTWSPQTAESCGASAARAGCTASTLLAAGS